MTRLTRLKRTGKQILAEASGKNIPFMAAGIAYNAFVSLAPILVLVLLVVSAAGGGLEDRLAMLAEQWLPGPVADVVVQVFQSEGASPGASVVSFVVLIWGTLKVFRGLDTAFSEIYETTKSNGFVDTILDAAVVLIAVVIAIVATVGVTTVFVQFSDVLPFIGLLTSVALIAGLIVAFLPMYYRFPDTQVGWVEVLPGVVFAAVGWAVFQALFRVYLTFGGEGAGDFFGTVIVIITWLYFSGMLLLFGAVINAVHGGHTSEKAGGVGAGATGYETRREESMNREEFATYLGTLQTGFTGRREKSRGTAGGGRFGQSDSNRFRQSDGRIEVIEQTTPDDDGQRWEVAFRWRSLGEDEDDDSGESLD